MAFRVYKACLIAIALSMIQLVGGQLVICMFGKCCMVYLRRVLARLVRRTSRCRCSGNVATRLCQSSSGRSMVRLVIQRHSSGNAENRVNRWVMEFDKGQDVAAREYVRENYSPAYAQKLFVSLVDPDIGRDICICSSCSPHVNTTSYNQALAFASVITPSIRSNGGQQETMNPL